MDTLIIISSKSPNQYLYPCIDNLYKLQITDPINQKICIIDSDSKDITIYTIIKNKFPYVEIHFAKNKNYEYGAYKYAYSLYPNYNKYICIQDSIILNNKIPLDIVNDTNSYIFYHFSGYNHHLSIKEEGIENLKNSNLKYETLINTPFCLAQHSSFIVSNLVIKNIFDALPIPPVNKNGSCFYERNFGLYFILNNIKTHDLYNFFSKYSGYRI
jgi:hypothetical protein